MVFISKYDERRKVIDVILKIIKEDRCLDEDKSKIYNIVMELDKKTYLQKERFIRYYGLQPAEYKKETYKEIASSYNCTTSAVRCSVISVQVYLWRMKDKEFKKLEDIYNKYQN